MGASKTELFTKQQIELAGLAKALGHPARISILQHLVKTEACICGDLVNEIGLAQPTISQHLTVLKRVGLIRGKVSGPGRCYCINTEVWNHFRSMVSDILRKDSDTDIKCC